MREVEESDKDRTYKEISIQQERKKLESSDRKDSLTVQFFLNIINLL